MILYIAKRGPHDIGSKLHLQALKEIYGSDNVFVVDLLNRKPEKKERYISFGKYRGLTDRVIRWLQGNTSFISNKIIREICRIIEKEKIGLVFSEESDLGNLMKAIKTQNKDVRIICFYHDISADLFAQRKKQASWLKPHYKFIECNNTIRQERINQQYTDENWVFNSADKEKFVRYYGYEPNAVIPLCAPAPQIEDFCQITPAGETKNILFVCSAYYVNIIGFMWFYHNVFPKISGDFRLSIVGTGSPILEKKIHDNRIEFVGPVESLDGYYRKADIIISPIFDGGGMKVKMIEAVSYGKCILATNESMHGFWESATDEIKNKVLFCYDEPERWIDTLNSLLEADICRHDPNVYKWFCETFSYGALLKYFRKGLSNNSTDG